MSYVLAALLPPLGLLFNGQPFSALLNVVLLVVCIIFGLIFPVLFFVPSAHAILAVYMKREDRKHREVVEAIRQHGPPPGYPANGGSATPHQADRQVLSASGRRT